jgi:hypothetical protein
MKTLMRGFKLNQRHKEIQMTYTNYNLAWGQPKVNIVDEGELFYEATVFYVNIPCGATNLMLSSQPYGDHQRDGEGKTLVDDTLTLTMSTQSASKIPPASYCYTYSPGPGVYPIAIDPVDLFSENSDFQKFKGEMVKVKVELNDTFGGQVSSSNLYLSVKT